MKKLFQKYKEFILYFIVGVLSTVINLGLYGVLTWLMPDNLYLLANIFAWLVSVTFGFFMYKFFVFQSKSTSVGTFVKEGLAFYGARVFSLGLETAGLWLLVDICRFSSILFRFEIVASETGNLFFALPISGELCAKFLMLVFVTVSNYIFSKFVIFRKKNKENA